MTLENIVGINLYRVNILINFYFLIATKYN
jgi:hypothetical protein